MTYPAELRDCLELILGTRPPEPEPGSDPLLVTRQWLAERNLGLVGVADPAGFDWPGHWIARVRTGSGDHAVVMFGSPSGPLHDPWGALAGDGVLLYETFAAGNEAFGRPTNPEFLLRPGELLQIVRGRLSVIAFEQGRVDGDRPAVVQRMAAVGLRAAWPTELAR